MKYCNNEKVACVNARIGIYSMDSEKFCNHCGQELVPLPKCECGKELFLLSLFCPDCGKQVKEMKQFSIYIKSHGEMPDYEKTINAATRAEALENFCIDLNKNDYGDYWSPESIEDFVREEII